MATEKTPEQKRAAALRQIELMLGKAAKNDSQAEVEMIMARVTKLMTRHQIDAGEITGDPNAAQQATIMGQFVFTVDNMDNCGSARKHTVSMVVEAFGGRTVFIAQRNATGSGIYTIDVHIFASDSTIETLRLLLPSLVLQLENCLRKDSSAYRSRLREDPDHWYVTARELNRLYQTYRRNYVLGFGASVAAKIKAMRTETIDESEGTGTAALVLLSEAERAEALRNETFKRLAKTHPMRGYNRDGDRDGRKAGAAALVGQDEVAEDSGRPALAR